MPLVNVLTVQVRPEKIRRYEELAKHLAERAVSKGESWRWTTHHFITGEIGRFAFVSEAADFAEFGARGELPDLMDRVLGPQQAEKFTLDAAACTVSQRYEISRDRPDLSYPPEQVDRTYPAALVTVLKARPGGQEACEEVVRKISEAIPKVGDTARIITYQTLLGDLFQLWMVRPIADLAELDQQRQPQDLLNEAFGAAEGGLIYRAGLDAIESAERGIAMYRSELSNPI